MISTQELGVMSISQQILYICYQVKNKGLLSNLKKALTFFFFLKIPFGLASAGNIYIGQLLGANQPKKAKNATKVLASIAG